VAQQNPRDKGGLKQNEGLHPPLMLLHSIPMTHPITAGALPKAVPIPCILLACSGLSPSFDSDMPNLLFPAMITFPSFLFTVNTYTLNVVAAGSPKTQVNTYNTAWHINLHCNKKSNLIQNSVMFCRLHRPNL
jgi:hypothetical protein